MIISLVAAMDKNGLIGKGNGMPWYLPADFRHFREITMNKPIVMGRKTFESIGRPLPGRKNIVISGSGFQAEGVTVVENIAAALAEVSDAPEVMIIGGAAIYKQMIDRADRMYLTHVDAECSGDAWFPDFEADDWDIVSTSRHEADDQNNYSFTIRHYHRRN